jgi:hypothetical protein
MMTQSILAIAAAFSACTDLPAGDIKSPRFWGDYMLNKYAAERALGPLEVGPTPLAQPRTVLLITGVTIPAVWFDPIKARLERDGFRPVVYEPPDLLSGDLTENSEALAVVVDQIRAQTGETKIDILAECTGGVIARHYIQSLGGDQAISRMVTFISPQHGLPKAPLAKSFVGWEALDDLTPGSPFLEEVNSAPLPPNVAFTSIYSCTDEYIQPYETSIIPGAKNIGLCDGFVGHYSFFWDPEIYLVMHGALTEPVAADPGSPAEPMTPDDPTTAADDTGGCSTGGGSTSGLSLVLGAFVFGLRRRRASARR